MKTTLLTALILSLVTPLMAHDGHDHEKKTAQTTATAEKKAGPNGGRLFVNPAMELFIRDDRRLQVTFLDKEGKPLLAPEAKVTATGGDRSNPTRFSFKVEDGMLLSNEVLPEGNQVPLVLQVRKDGKEKAVTNRLTVNLAQCPSCEYKEYACVCAHGGEDSHQH